MDMNKLMADGDELTGRRLEGYLLRHPEKIREIEEQTAELVMLVLEQDVGMLRFIREQTEEVCRYAIALDPYAVMYVREPTAELVQYGCDLQPGLKDKLPERMLKMIAA